MNLNTAAIVWLLDSGVEPFFAVSLGTLRLNSPSVWHDSVKVIFDCGLSQKCRSFLASVSSEGVRVFRLSDVEPSLLHADYYQKPGLLPMRARILVARLLERLRSRGDLPRIDVCLVCDCDTAFLREFGVPVIPGGSDILVMKEWDIRAGVERPLLFLRQSTFDRPLGEVPLDLLSTSLGIPASALVELPTYNTGVVVICPANCGFVDAWLAEYEQLLAIRDTVGRKVFAVYSAEQNALSLALYRRTVRGMPLSRRYNQFPPRPPKQWPTDTIIAHFITFTLNHQESRYGLWFKSREGVRGAGWVPGELLPDPRLTKLRHEA